MSVSLARLVRSSWNLTFMTTSVGRIETHFSEPLCSDFRRTE
jgi:hypothetical protein